MPKLASVLILAVPLRSKTARLWALSSFGGAARARPIVVRRFGLFFVPARATLRNHPRPIFVSEREWLRSGGSDERRWSSMRSFREPAPGGDFRRRWGSQSYRLCPVSSFDREQGWIHYFVGWISQNSLKNNSVNGGKNILSASRFPDNLPAFYVVWKSRKKIHQ
jgi:hypothetical protein